MDFDPEIVGWLSATENLADLYSWFSENDILELEKRGWYVHVYQVEAYRFYDRFQHYLICQQTSKIIDKLVLTPPSNPL